jgi:hypothetical protein
MPPHRTEYGAMSGEYPGVRSPLMHVREVATELGLSRKRVDALVGLVRFPRSGVGHSSIARHVQRSTPDRWARGAGTRALVAVRREASNGEHGKR